MIEGRKNHTFSELDMRADALLALFWLRVHRKTAGACWRSWRSLQEWQSSHIQLLHRLSRRALQATSWATWLELFACRASAATWW
jgi:hypothetical protein